MLLGAWLDLLLGRSEVWDAALEAKVKATKADVTLECEECEEVIFEADMFDSSFNTGEGVASFVLALVPFLGMQGWTSWFYLRFSKPQKQWICWSDWIEIAD